MKTNEQILMAIMQQAQAFLLDYKRLGYRVWIETKEMHVYVRISEREINDREAQCFDVANISVAERYQKRGLFGTFMEEIHKLHPCEFTYLENVRSPVICKWCAKRGWKEIENPWYPSYYLPQVTYERLTQKTQVLGSDLSSGLP